MTSFTMTTGQVIAIYLIANVPSLLLENASHGAFLLGEQSSFEDLQLCQKYFVLLGYSDSRSKGERGRDDMAM
jgi:hypothetical protein